MSDTEVLFWTSEKDPNAIKICRTCRHWYTDEYTQGDSPDPEARGKSVGNCCESSPRDADHHVITEFHNGCYCWEAEEAIRAEVREFDDEDFYYGDDVQRVPSVLRWWCPTCGEAQDEHCNEGLHLKYPPIGVPFKEILYCSACKEAGRDSRHTIRLRIMITLEAVGVEK